ncbi:MFS transporter [Mycobacteroides abscessus]|nr:MFS transporter [Mycobacteroides abscessus]RIS05523.1 MFS transporter [Mycobacteroides abscessus]
MDFPEQLKTEGVLGKNSGGSSGGESHPSTSGLPRALRPMRHRDYRLLTLGLAITLLGNGMWTVALVWQVIRMGLGPAQVAVVGTTFSVGLLLSVLPAGVAADRLPKLWVMRCSLAVQTALMLTTATLALTGAAHIWHLALNSLLFGIAEGFYIPAYTALLPSLLPADELLAANGIEGILRPVMQLAAGPAVSAAIVSVWSPGGAFLLEGMLVGAGLSCLLLVRHKHEPPASAEVRQHPLRRALADLAEGFRYMVRTTWFFATLLFAIGYVLVVVGPIEILLPFVIRDHGGDPGAHATVLALFGLAGAVGSFIVSSLPLARRYLTVMILMWGAGSLPLIFIGFTGHVWMIAVAMIIVGGTMQAANVIWGTLMQRRVPEEMLGRAASMDFFVSLVGLPASFALVVPVAHVIGNTTVFVIAGVVPLVLAAAAHIVARLGRDEMAHPLG